MLQCICSSVWPHQLERLAHRFTLHKTPPLIQRLESRLRHQAKLERRPNTKLNTLTILKTNIKVKPLPNLKTTPFIPGKPPPHSKDKYQGKAPPLSYRQSLSYQADPLPILKTNIKGKLLPSPKDQPSHTS